MKEQRWATPTLSAYRSGQHKSLKDTRDFLLFRLEEWMLKPALFLMASQPEIPGHLCSLILLATSVRQAAAWAGLTIDEAVDLYATWGNGDHIRRDLIENVYSLATQNAMNGRTEYCSDPEEMPASNTFTRSRGPLTFHTLRLSEELAHIARGCVADIPYARLRIVAEKLEDLQ